MRLAVLRAPSAAVAPERSIGTWPAPEKNFRWNQPLMPGVVKYSALATKVTRRGRVSGMKSQSAYDRWLLARIAGPVAGTFSAPETCGRKTIFSHGPIATHLRNQ
jgi:hypothetical protein